MYSIQTRQQPNREKWWCNGTINGYDISFEGGTAKQAREKMRAYLMQKGIRPQEVEWDEEAYYVGTSYNPKPQIGYSKSRIDNNPIG